MGFTSCTVGHLRTSLPRNTSTGTIIAPLDLSDYAGETLCLRFRTFTDDDDGHGENGSLLIDDMRILGYPLPLHDAAVSKVILPFPTTVGYPNPFNPSVTIPYSLPGTLHVTLNVYNVL